MSLWLLVVACGGSPAGGGPDGGGGGGDGGGDLDAAVDAASDVSVVRVHYPAGARALTVRGSGGPLSWTAGVAMTAGADDTWTLAIEDLAAPVELKPLLDDAMWSRGPNYHLRPGETIDLYPHFTSERGQVVTLVQRFASAQLGDQRTIRAYLPPSYAENTRARYPVVYMHDGQNLFDPATAFGGNEWRVDEAFDAAATAGRCESGASCQNDGDCGTGACLTTREAIVIGIDNQPDRIWELTPTRDDEVGDGGGGDRYLAMITGELKPMVDSMLRTRPGVDDTALAGSSLGGLISAYGGVKEPDVFGMIGAFSPSTWWDERVILAEVAGTAGAAVRPRRVYVDSGDAGPSMDGVVDTRVLVETYDQAGFTRDVDLRFVEQSGATHSEVYWAQRFPAAMFWLLGPRP